MLCYRERLIVYYTDLNNGLAVGVDFDLIANCRWHYCSSCRLNFVVHFASRTLVVAFVRHAAASYMDRKSLDVCMDRIWSRGPFALAFEGLFVRRHLSHSSRRNAMACHRSSHGRRETVQPNKVHSAVHHLAHTWSTLVGQIFPLVVVRCHKKDDDSVVVGLVDDFLALAS